MSELPDAARREMLRTMERIRQFESRVETLFEDGELPGFVHLYIGEEAVATGVCQALSEDDYIASTHRGHGHCIAKGHDLEPMMAELFGKEAGYNGGKGGSMHIADPGLGNLGANGIVGAGIPIGVGAALSCQMRSTDGVAAAFFGDGALAQGAFHEALNLASLWELPFVGVVEHNHYGELSATEDQQAIDDLTARADSYGIRGVDVDGMDVEAVYDAATTAVERARRGDGPTLLVCDTYRFVGHHEGDTEFYRDEEEVERYRERDPVETYRTRLVDADVITQEEADTLREEVTAEVDDAVSFSRESAFPPEEAAFTNVYAEGSR